MPPRARHRRLRDLIEQQGFVAVKDVAAKFAVSEMTIRRDLDLLSRAGIVMRTHGGAVGQDQHGSELFFSTEPAFERRRLVNAAEKGRIARLAASLLPPEQTIALDVGTSNLALAMELAGRKDLRIFTNSLAAAVALLAGRGSIYLLGGQLRGPEFAIIGSTTCSQIQNYYFDRCFIGISGVTEDGFHDYIIEDSDVKRALIARSAAVTILCDSSKFNRRSLARISSLDKCTTLITDQAPTPGMHQALTAAGVEILVAEEYSNINGQK
ncbi:transcriptional regulator, DeoR family [Arboricoccus pini]|uniref:Transcriptional regulator, DeoR family n=1 Tax=Arboricoccus pini TaxID=1963835 RepID=A0A212RYV4_9PROT|nr:DeoR/GlpR family DNA-binding transcription regulator [Arboricoccus pini]SNB77988.1 transcriptional regulator, DeoR family [Arboricoccus pini]